MHPSRLGDSWSLTIPCCLRALSGLLGREALVEACARTGVSVLLSGHTHVPSVDIVTMEAVGLRRQALAVGAGTAISRRTRGVSNTYAVLELEEPMMPGAQITVRILQPEGTTWRIARSKRFAYGPQGVVACPPEGI